jgi:intracellular sulfur oxidation DsrE/DsrF family protein
MKKLSLVLLGAVLLAGAATTQSGRYTPEQNRAFTGAKASLKNYHAIYQMDSNDPRIIEKTIRNINNALSDPRLNGRLEVELIAFSGGTDAYLKGSKYEAPLRELIAKGVIVAQCSNTLKERKISPDELFDFIALVPSGNGELIIRQAEGWSVVKP